MNIITTIQAALTALNSNAELFLLERARAENEELNHTDTVIVVYPDWKSNNKLSQGIELMKTQIYNIDFKTLDEWDNSDGNLPTAYDSKTSVQRIDEMEVLADSIFSYISAQNGLFPEIQEKLRWEMTAPILRANNGTMSGVSVRLTIVTSGIRICNFNP